MNNWLPTMKYSQLYPIKTQKDIVSIIELVYNVFKKELMNIEKPLTFNGRQIVINTPIFDCSKKFTKKGKNCNNTLFNCDICPFKGKEEMFFHLVSNRDDEIIPKLKSKYRNGKQKRRVPGLFSPDRLDHINWIRLIIEEYENNKNPDIEYFEDESSSKERIIFFWVKSCNFIVIIGENLWDRKQPNYYLKSAYVVTNDQDFYKFQRLCNKYKKRQNITSGVL